MHLLVPFVLQNIKKTLWVDPELWGCAIFGPKIAHLPWFGTNHCYYFHLLIDPFHCAKFKKILTAGSKKLLELTQIYDNVPSLGPKWTISRNENFFIKPVNESCFFHSCLSACLKLNSDINLLVKYWWLKNTEIS